MRRLLAVATVAGWALALLAWPHLPPEIPMHFGLSGRPDRWADKGVLAWFLLPALATVFAVTFAWLLPRWLCALARANSRFLNVPDAARFRALSEQARVRVVDRLRPGLAAVGLAVVATIDWIVFATARVACGDWQVLPMLPTLAGVAAIVAAATWLAFVGQGAVRREVARDATRDVSLGE